MGSKRRIRRNSCEGKNKLTQEEASVVSKRLPSLQHYRCAFCGFWHNGHKSAKTRAVEKRKRME